MGYLRGYLMGLQVHFYVFLLFIYPPNMVFIRNFPVFSRNIGERIPQIMRLVPANVWGKVGEHLGERMRAFEGKLVNVWGKGMTLVHACWNRCIWYESRQLAHVFATFSHEMAILSHNSFQVCIEMRNSILRKWAPKTGKSIEIGGENMNFEACEHSNLMHLVPFSSVGAMEPCLRQYCNLL